MIVVVVMIVVLVLAVVMVVIVVQLVIVQVLSNRADLVRQRLFNSRRFSLAPRHAAYIGWVHSQTFGYAIIDAPKKRYGRYRNYATINFVTNHDDLSQRNLRGSAT